jgi:hypothetical protein
MILLAALAVAWPTWAQDPAQKAEAAKPAALKAAKTTKKSPAKQSAVKRHQDARHCLQRANNDAIIRCAEEYL